MAAANSRLPRFFGVARNSLEPTSSGLPTFGTNLEGNRVSQDLAEFFVQSSWQSKSVR